MSPLNIYVTDDRFEKRYNSNPSLMKKVSKSDIRQAVTQAIVGVLEKLEIAKPSKKTRKNIGRITKQIKVDWKKAARRNLKAGKHLKNGKTHAKADAQTAA